MQLQSAASKHACIHSLIALIRGGGGVGKRVCERERESEQIDHREIPKANFSRKSQYHLLENTKKLNVNQIKGKIFKCPTVHYKFKAKKRNGSTQREEDNYTTPHLHLHLHLHPYVTCFLFGSLDKYQKHPPSLLYFLYFP